MGGNRASRIARMGRGRTRPFEQGVVGWARGEIGGVSVRRGRPRAARYPPDSPSRSFPSGAADVVVRSSMR